MAIALIRARYMDTPFLQAVSRSCSAAPSCSRSGILIGAHIARSHCFAACAN